MQTCRHKNAYIITFCNDVMSTCRHKNDDMQTCRHLNADMQTLICRHADTKMTTSLHFLTMSVYQHADTPYDLLPFANLVLLEKARCLY